MPFYRGQMTRRQPTALKDWPEGQAMPKRRPLATDGEWAPLNRVDVHFGGRV